MTRRRIPKNLQASAREFADVLDEIGGPELANVILDSLLINDDPLVTKAMKKLKGSQLLEVAWICGWFQGIADTLGCSPQHLLDSARKLAPGGQRIKIPR